MKKLLILTLVTVMILCMTSMTLAAEYSSIMGGRYYGYISNIEGDRGLNPAPGVDAWDTILGATVRKDNSWATIKFIADSWNQKIYHSFGIDNIGGSPLSIGFDSHDSGTANLGQQFMGDLFNDFKADPYFNTCDMAGSINFKVITDSFEVRGEARVYDDDGSTVAADGYKGIDDYDEAYALGFIFKSDIGKFYIGGKGKSTASTSATSQGTTYDPLLIVGADFQINDAMGLKVDFWSDPDGMSNQGEFTNAFWLGGGHKTLQATLTVNDITGQLMFSQPEAKLDDIFGIGASYKIDKWLVGAKYFKVDKLVAPQDKCFYDVYGMYNVGAWDIKFGTSNAQFPYGHCGDKTQGGNYNSKQAFESEDPFFYAGVHFEF